MIESSFGGVHHEKSHNTEDGWMDEWIRSVLGSFGVRLCLGQLALV